MSLLRLSGTDLAYAATRPRFAERVIHFRVLSSYGLSSYARARRCPEWDRSIRRKRDPPPHLRVYIGGEPVSVSCTLSRALRASPLCAYEYLRTAASTDLEIFLYQGARAGRARVGTGWPHLR
eukprot:3471436-Rhodomonas_salina.3